MTTVLVVGGAGYVGSVLTEELLARGYRVRILDRLYFGDEGLRAVRDQVDLVVGDMRAVGAEVLEGVDAVINVGGLSNDPTAEYNPRANHEMNTVAAAKLAELSKELGVRRYIYASSCSIYDRGLAAQEHDIVQDESAEVATKAAYSRSKYDAERLLIAMADDSFCPIILRKGTIYGFSPRMRYDLVVNAFVKNALTGAGLSLYNGGEMWRPLLDVRDAAKAYIACLEAEEDTVKGQVFNVCHSNMRISELALRTREALASVGIEASILPDYSERKERSYRVSTRKIEQTLGFRSEVSVEASVVDMVEKTSRRRPSDLDNPKYYNIRWMCLLDESYREVHPTGSVFDVDGRLPSLKRS